tara:strand:- start:810 stop:953 length:144 start_codon:yes stop_codon:yes gene_type:complete
MSAIDVEKNKDLEKVKKRKNKGVEPLKSKDKRYFGKIRKAIKDLNKK